MSEQSSSGAERPLRVAQWATGNIGRRSLRAVIEHPRMALAGVFVYDAAKVGHDAAELCGVAGPTGIVATNTIDEIVAARPDCVLYMPRSLDVDEVCRLLASGANVVTTRGEFHRPASIDPEIRQRVETACAAGGTSIHSTGSSPGFITEAVPLVLASIQRRLDLLTIDEFADLTPRNSPGLLFDVMGFGRAPQRYSQARLTHGRVAFGPSLQLTAEALGLDLDDIEATGEVAVAAERTEIAAGVIEAGHVAAQRMNVTGIRHGRAIIRFRATWYCTKNIDADWFLGDTGWHISVEGDTPLEVSLRFPTPVDQMASVTPGYTAHRAVNAVRYVCAAEPGIRTSLDLPQIIAEL